MITFLYIFLLFAVLSTAIYCYNRFWQKKHALLITHPITGPFRYVIKFIAHYTRGHHYNDWIERPFNRLTRRWIYKSSKGISNYISFGSEENPNEPGTIIFVNSTFPILEKDSQSFPGKWIGKTTCKFPYFAKSFFNISGMSFGSIGSTAITALAKGSNSNNIWINTGEGGLSDYHLHSENIVFQIGTAKYGCRDSDGKLDREKIWELSRISKIKMFEIKLSQGAKPGSGGILPAPKVTLELARIRGIDPYTEAKSPNRHKEIQDIPSLMHFVEVIRTITEKPVGIKLALGGDNFLNEYFSQLLIHPNCIPDYIHVDGTEAGTGAAPPSLADHVGLPLGQALVLLTNKLNEYKLRDKICVIASGKLVTPDKVAWALCLGADFIVTGRGFLLSLGCIQSMICASGKCPMGITTNNPRYSNALDPELKSKQVANYAEKLIHEVEIIAHSCGLTDPSLFTRTHASIITGIGRSKTLDKEFPPIVRQK